MGKWHILLRHQKMFKETQNSDTESEQRWQKSWSTTVSDAHLSQHTGPTGRDAYLSQCTRPTGRNAHLSQHTDLTERGKNSKRGRSGDAAQRHIGGGSTKHMASSCIQVSEFREPARGYRGPDQEMLISRNKQTSGPSPTPVPPLSGRSL